jgi:4-amino-4-deoxy-L-arabinose transferase-like glycosyltransferase
MTKSPAAALRRSEIVTPLLVFCLTRLTLVCIGVVAEIVLLPGHSTASPPSDGLANLVASGWNRWDSGWYLGIAASGYTYDPATHVGSIAFFPLYPILVRLAAGVVGSPAWAGLFVSNLLFLIALIILYRLIARRFGKSLATASLILLATFPFAYFYGAIYTESLFLLLSALAFTFAESERWWLAGLAGALAALTRLAGIAFGPTLLVTYLEHRQFQWRKLDWAFLAPALVPLGTASFVLYNFFRFGDPLAFYTASLYGWGRHNVVVAFETGSTQWLDPTRLTPGDYDLVLQLNLVLALVWLALTVAVARRIGIGYAVFVLIGTLVPLSAGLESLGRYIAVLFPAYIVMAAYLKERALLPLAIAGSAALLGLFTALFATGNWVI